MNNHDFNFNGLGIAPKITETLIRLNFSNPTPIQHKAIPIALEGKDLIGIAQTGTGKTMAFMVPTVQHLGQNNYNALVLVPTRELAIQVKESTAKITHNTKIKTVVLIGGDSIERQIHALASRPRILIATPGRLIDHIERRTVNLSHVGILVLDEADRMLDMGFAPQIERIMQVVSKKRQTLLFSATMPSAILKIASTHMQYPVQVEIAPSGTVAEKVSHELFIVRKEMKRELLSKVLAQYRGSVLLFCRTKIGAQKIAKALRAHGHRSSEIHSDRSLSQRREALEGFKTGKYRILVATDIAARGIDVKGIELVINYDLPDDAENYVHRIGRTGRAGMAGHAISFATPDQRKDVRDIERIMKIALPISQHPGSTVEKFDEPKTMYSAQRSGGRFRRPMRHRRR